VAVRKFSISCTDIDWTRIKLAAEQAGAKSAARFVVDRALSVDLPVPGENTPEKLVLDPGQQRGLVDQVAEIEKSLRDGPVPEALLEQVQRRVAFLLRAFVEDLVRAGQDELVVATALEVLGHEAVPAVRAWIEQIRPDIGTRP
jgi:hypothetical protein